MSKKHTTNATPKYLGYVYQVLVAIEQCLDAPKNKTIWLECYGDIYNGTTSTEVKHHFKKGSLANNSVDFWKTLKNLVTEDISDFENLILHTTESISEKSIFAGWNDLTKTKKYNILKEHKPCDTVQPFYDATIIKYKRKDLLPILDKLVIKSSQLSVKDMWEEISKHRTLDLIDEKHKEDAVDWIYGHFNKEAINDRYEWRIKVNDYIQDSRRALSKYTSEKIPFPIIEKTSIKYDKTGLDFVRKMKAIKLNSRPIERAVYDYLRSNNAEVQLLTYEPITMAQALDDFDNAVLDDCLEAKESLAMDYDEIEIKISKKLFYSCLKLPDRAIRGVEDTQSYYKKGRIHHHINISNFDWEFYESDFQ